MKSHKDEFRALMEEQLADLHRRIVELAALAPHSHEHAISWDTVVGDCQKKHVETVARLRELDAHDEVVARLRQRIRAEVEELERTIEKHEKRAR